MTTTRETRQDVFHVERSASLPKVDSVEPDELISICLQHRRRDIVEKNKITRSVGEHFDLLQSLTGLGQLLFEFEAVQCVRACQDEGGDLHVVVA